MPKKQNGIGLLELMLALAIIAMMMVAASKYYKSTQLANRVQSAVESAEALYAASERYVLDGGQPYDTTTDQVSTLQKGGYLPSEFPGPWGYNIYAHGVDGTHLIMELSNVPQGACLSLQDKLKNKMFVTDVTCTGDKLDVLNVKMDGKL